MIRTRSLKQKREREKEREKERDKERFVQRDQRRRWSYARMQNKYPQRSSSSSSAHERRAEHGTWGSLTRSHSHLTRGDLWYDHRRAKICFVRSHWLATLVMTFCGWPRCRSRSRGWMDGVGMDRWDSRIHPSSWLKKWIVFSVFIFFTGKF